MLDVHLMIERPERHVGDFTAAGADSVTFHAEATPHASYTADLIRASGASVAVAINPATPVGALAEVADAIDMALCMTVNPGWGGQPFIEHSLRKIPRLRAIIGKDDGAGGRRWHRRRHRAGAAGRRGRTCSSPARRSSPSQTRVRPTWRSRDAVGADPESAPVERRSSSAAEQARVAPA